MLFHRFTKNTSYIFFFSLANLRLSPKSKQMWKEHKEDWGSNKSRMIWHICYQFNNCFMVPNLTNFKNTTLQTEMIGILQVGDVP